MRRQFGFFWINTRKSLFENCDINYFLIYCSFFFTLFIAVLLRSRRLPAVTLLDNFVKLNTNNWLLDSFHSVMVIQLHF